METHQIILILDDDLMITEGLAAGLARRNRTMITCNDLEGGELVVEWLKPSHVVSDIRLSGAFGYEGLDFLRFVKRLSPDTRVILMTGDAPDSLQLEASERGAVGFLQKPFEIGELDSLLDIMAPARSGSEDWPDIIRVPDLDQILRGKVLSTVFQPIVKIATGEQLGFEALTRISTDSLMRNPETLFRYASRKQRIPDLELSCIAQSYEAASALPAGLPIFMNVHPEAFASGDRLHDAIVDGANSSGIGLNRVVVELTEQGSLGGGRQGLEVIRELRRQDVRFAFDDVGTAYSHLPYIDSVRPSFLKISQHFGTNFEIDPTRTKIVRNVLALAREFDCELIIEGVETAATAAAASELGIKYGQGYFFARPSSAETFHRVTVEARS